MKNIEIDEELYQHIASNTQYIGESASSILRRLIKLPAQSNTDVAVESETIEPVTDVVGTKVRYKIPPYFII